MHDNYYLHCATKLTSQQQATVKFHGVFASHWKSLAFAPGWSIRKTLVWDSGNLVIPFMQAVNQTARHFAHVCYFYDLFNKRRINISVDLLYLHRGSDYIFICHQMFGV